MNKKLSIGAGLGLLLLLPTLAIAEIEYSGWVGVEALYFPEDGIDSDQRSGSFSVLMQPQVYMEWDDRQQNFLFEPFYRFDSKDKERTHADIRQMKWAYIGDEWEAHVGVGKVFWGVAESLHLVDVINQTDQVDNINGEAKLGQPMINLILNKEWGALELFVLPGFRERDFPGKAGRFRSVPFVDTDKAQFEANSEEDHVDWAVRYSHSMGIWDMGFAHFSGTNRAPVLQPALDKGELILIPVYNLIDQTSLDLQATMGAWLWKLEAISQQGQGRRFFASVAGLEYTFFAVQESEIDVGVLIEYLYDDRKKKATTLFEDDVFLGVRVDFNNTQDTAILAGVIYDLESHTQVYLVEASHRIDDYWQVSLQGQVFTDTSGDLAGFFKNDDNMRLELTYWF
jgi:hypothetical protein